MSGFGIESCSTIPPPSTEIMSRICRSSLCPPLLHLQVSRSRISLPRLPLKRSKSGSGNNFSIDGWERGNWEGDGEMRMGMTLGGCWGTRGVDRRETLRAIEVMTYLNDIDCSSVLPHTHKTLASVILQVALNQKMATCPTKRSRSTKSPRPDLEHYPLGPNIPAKRKWPIGYRSRRGVCASRTSRSACFPFAEREAKAYPNSPRRSRAVLRPGLPLGICRPLIKTGQVNLWRTGST